MLAGWGEVGLSSGVDRPPSAGVARAGPPLVELLATLPDPRKPRGRIRPLTAVLSRTAVALLAGMKSLEAIAQLGRDPAFAARPFKAIPRLFT